MILNPPYVVLVTAPSAGVGQSTLASNLAIYLKGIEEDLPVAYVSCDALASQAMFALPTSKPGDFSELQQGADLGSLLALGEFGVQFGSVDDQLTIQEQPNWLRRELARVDFDGVMILDLNGGHPLLPAALWAADLVLAPLKDPAQLGDLVTLRREFVSGGGSEGQFWLVPSELGAESRYRCSTVKLDDLLRFAAEERNFQIFAETFSADLQVQVEAAEKAKPVLTRVPQSMVHQYLYRLAVAVLDDQRQQNSSVFRIERWRRDGELPERAGRVPLLCPLCQHSVLGGMVHYLEAFPARQRLLLHEHCVVDLFKNTGAKAFLPSAGLWVVQSGSVHGESSEEVLLQGLSPELDVLNTELPALNETWERLLRCATGRHFSELYRERLLISPLVSVVEALSSGWYRQFVLLRRRLRKVIDEEKI